MNKITNCGYCLKQINSSNYLHCKNCNKDVHIKCLKNASTPGDLFGDVFFDFICINCADQQDEMPTTSRFLNNVNYNNKSRELFIRQRIPWVVIVTLTLYNLSIKCKGLSHHGYFHWRTHIMSFIEKNWDFFFDNTVRKRKKNWIGTISGTLSHNCPGFFQSGQDVLKESGWWRLTYADKSPRDIFQMYEQECLKRQKMRLDKRQLNENSDSEPCSKKSNKTYDSEDDILTCARTLPYMGRQPRLPKTLQNSITAKNVKSGRTHNVGQSHTSLNTVQSSLMDFLAESLASDDLSMFNSMPNMPPEPLMETSSSSCRGVDDSLALLGNDNASLALDHNMIHAVDLNNYSYNNLQLQQQQQHQHQQTNCNPMIDFSLKNTLNLNDMEDGNTNKNTLTNKRDEGLQQQYQQQCANDTQNYSCSDNDGGDDDNDNDDDDDDDDDDDENYQPRIVQVINFQQLSADERNGKENCTTNTAIQGKPVPEDSIKGVKLKQNDKGKKEDGEEEEEEDEEFIATTCPPSLFTKHPRRPLPWLVERKCKSDTEESDEEDNDDKDNQIKHNTELHMISEYEESELLQKLRTIFNVEEKCQIKIPSYVRRFYRKLCIRAWKRDHGKPLLNIDKYGTHKMYNTTTDAKRILSRYQLLSLTSDVKRTFYSRIAGNTEYELFVSPYTQRVLHPFIYRNRKCFPPFLMLMCELQSKVNKSPATRAPIDFCYVRPNHMPAVNALLQTEFWPGIDMSECLSYPDFSVVALYKKLVIGCGFLVPDVGYNEAYISFMAVRPGWQRSGIATFMLYHLIQTCMTKDITLHVAATNPAVMLYQKFGFKIEEIILNFYDEYLPLDSKHSRHAFFLRLMR